MANQDRKLADKEVGNSRRDAKGRFRTGESGNPEARWKPGQSGNPAGRPKKELSITSLAKALLEANPDLAEEMAKKWLDQVVKGQTEARRDLQDRLEGRVPLPIQAQVEMRSEVKFVIGKGYVNNRSED